LARNRDSATMIGDDAINPSQPQPTVLAAGFGGEERLEDAREYLWFDALARIYDLGADIGARTKPGAAILNRLRQLDVSREHADSPAGFRQRLDRVFEDLNER